ncbi:hypothetical protein ACH5RR_012464 [Cinchona calisaya]|uniref:TTF-type domain-containing protein n=1 Tax=Cinchona calisaya TaxID=153742 RepID=A0ABD3ADM4_9GENT
MVISDRVKVKDLGMSTLEETVMVENMEIERPSNEASNGSLSGSNHVESLGKSFKQGGERKLRREEDQMTEESNDQLRKWQFPDWLEFSPTANGAYCLQWFLFIKPSNRPSQNAFTVRGFQSWKKVNDGVNCYFLRYASSTDHKNPIKASHDLMNPLQHIGKIIGKQTIEQIARNQLRLKASIDVVKWLSLQGVAFRGHDETLISDN